MAFHFNVWVVYRSGPTLRSLLTKVKDPLPVSKLSNVVYEIPCECRKVYIGETKRRLETRIKEHKVACERGQTEKLAVAEHFVVKSIVSFGMTRRSSSALVGPWSWS